MSEQKFPHVVEIKLPNKGFNQEFAELWRTFIPRGISKYILVVRLVAIINNTTVGVLQTLPMLTHFARSSEAAE